VSCAKTAEPVDLKEAQVQSYSPGGANMHPWQGTLAPPGEYD